jgi:hypothetical protein
VLAHLAVKRHERGVYGQWAVEGRGVVYGKREQGRVRKSTAHHSTPQYAAAGIHPLSSFKQACCLLQLVPIAPHLKQAALADAGAVVQLEAGQLAAHLGRISRR